MAWGQVWPQVSGRPEVTPAWTFEGPQGPGLTWGQVDLGFEAQVKVWSSWKSISSNADILQVQTSLIYSPESIIGGSAEAGK
jgi:hypothetical protein